MDAKTVEAPTVKQIVSEYLATHGYDGLYADDCGCLLDDDLMLCCRDGIDGCQPGYKQSCNCGEGCEWHVGPKREETDENAEMRARLKAGLAAVMELARLVEEAGDE